MRMHPGEPRPVIARMDGSGSSRRAVEFTTAEARRSDVSIPTEEFR